LAFYVHDTGATRGQCLALSKV